MTYALQGTVSDRDSDVEIRSPVAFMTPGAFSSPSVRTYSEAAELFPTRAIGVRLGYSRPDSDFDYDSYSVGAT